MTTKVISYAYKDRNGGTNKIVLEANFENMQISEKEMFEINGLFTRRNLKYEEEVFDTRCMRLYTYLNEDLVNEDVVYDFQTLISKYVEKKDFVRTTYVSPVEHAYGTMFLDDVMMKPELYEELIHILQEFDDSIISINSVNNKYGSSSNEYYTFQLWILFFLGY